MDLSVSHLVDDKLEEDTMTTVNSDDDYVDWPSWSSSRTVTL